MTAGRAATTKPMDGETLMLATNTITTSAVVIGGAVNVTMLRHARARAWAVRAAGPAATFGRITAGRAVRRERVYLLMQCVLMLAAAVAFLPILSDELPSGVAAWSWYVSSLSRAAAAIILAAASIHDRRDYLRIAALDRGVTP